jgi:hypothetical protein
MRADLEDAIGRIITSRGACRSFASAPADFALSLGLDEADTEALVSMRAELLCLMPSFVNKRHKHLRRAWYRTLSQLGERAESILHEFTDHCRPTVVSKADQLAFGEFLLRRTALLRGSLEHGAMIVDIARAERLINRAQWVAVPRLAPRSCTRPWLATKRSFDPEKPIRLDASASVDSFGWDLRSLVRYDPISITALQPDPCALLIYHTGNLVGVRIWRLRAGSARVVSELQRSDGGVTARELCRDISRPQTVLEVLSRMHAEGIVHSL